MNIDSAVGLLDAMANPLRLTILLILCERELCVGDICSLTGYRQSIVSRHLAALRVVEALTARKDGQFVFYRCDSLAVRRMLSVIDEILPDILASDGFFDYRLSESAIRSE
jgi:DNA-binding transcriptional ArsR family regulator